ncbi:ExbD/TolR family protein [Massilia sp. TWP1-3-3]|uniref:ExbD/TolR family protein n=1 Tax=Massilia sp. TWP1-3-3 TaxID=2804573 RepID=UPI003CE8E193
MSKHAAAPNASPAPLAEPMIDMNMTPLIDVMLVLIIMLIITIPRQQHATTLAMPTTSAQAEQPVVVSIDVDFDGTVLWNGLVLQSRAALESKLLAASRAAVPPQLQLRPNKLAPYKAVAGIMATAQRAGLLNIGIVGNEQFM